MYLDAIAKIISSGAGCARFIRKPERSIFKPGIAPPDTLGWIEQNLKSIGRPRPLHSKQGGLRQW